MNAYVKDTQKAIKQLDEWITDIDGVIHPDLLDSIQLLISEADQLCDQHNSIVDDCESFKQLLEDNGIEY